MTSHPSRAMIALTKQTKRTAPKAADGVTTITSEVCNGNQDVILQEVLKVGTSRLRVAIRSNAFAHQSSATVDLWNGTEWKLVHAIHFAKMATPAGLYTDRDPVPHATFARDRAELLRVALAVISA